MVHLEALDLLSKECESKVSLQAGSGLGLINSIDPFTLIKTFIITQRDLARCFVMTLVVMHCHHYFGDVLKLVLQDIIILQECLPRQPS